MTQLLSNEEISNLWLEQPAGGAGIANEFARAIEAAVLTKLREQEPFGYFYSDQNGSWRQAHDPQFLHAHVPLYAHPIPPSDVIRDAERYQWIRQDGWEEVEGIGVRSSGPEGFDADIDAAMKESK